MCFRCPGGHSCWFELSKADDDDNIHIVGSRLAWMCAVGREVPASP